jgi:hypothetical protein
MIEQVFESKPDWQQLWLNGRRVLSCSSDLAFPSRGEHQPEIGAGIFRSRNAFSLGIQSRRVDASFAKAAQEDPNCAMCYWGLALTVGPNYNLPMMAEPPAKVAWQALEQAEHGADRLRAGDAGGRRALSGRRRCPGADAEAMKNANAWKLAA